ncbi:hypothetical protein [Sorangium sp. So ce394]|uniref:hypothetical protein n=1 Tax=Sorangium sp. So ce394 TaxID=3133310 RepID=UPI003F5AEB24
MIGVIGVIGVIGATDVTVERERIGRWTAIARHPSARPTPPTYRLTGAPHRNM